MKLQEILQKDIVEKLKRSLPELNLFDWDIEKWNDLDWQICVNQIKKIIRDEKR